MRIAKRIKRGRHTYKWPDLELLVTRDGRGTEISVVRGALPEEVKFEECKDVPRFKGKRRSKNGSAKVARKPGGSKANRRRLCPLPEQTKEETQGPQAQEKAAGGAG